MILRKDETTTRGPVRVEPVSQEGLRLNEGKVEKGWLMTDESVISTRLRLTSWGRGLGVQEGEDQLKRA